MLEQPEYQAAVIIGRWQIPHVGHMALLQKALTLAPTVIIVIGSAFGARDTRNPFSWEERIQLLTASVPEEDAPRLRFLPVRDFFDDGRWDAAVQTGVAELTQRTDRVALIGFKKDHTSYYLDSFPGWSQVSVEPTVDIDASSLRKVYLESSDFNAAVAVLRPFVSSSVLAYLESWSKLPAFARLQREQAAVVAYRKKWAAPWYLTADAVVTCNHHVLLVRRGGDIGNGLWAIPGGFVNNNERTLSAALRELTEETNLEVGYPGLQESPSSSALFEHPLRSPRGRLVSQAYLFELRYSTLPEYATLPTVTAGDDAAEVRWVPFDDLPEYEDRLFEDHAAILDHFIGVFPK